MGGVQTKIATSPDENEPAEVVWASGQDASWAPSSEVFWACNGGSGEDPEHAAEITSLDSWLCV